MALTRSHPIDKGLPNAVDLRKINSGLYPREGVLPDPVTTAAAGIAYANGGWNIAARPFNLNTKRGGAPYSLAYGSAQAANDAAVNAWTIDPAPVSGTRTDRLWVRARDLSQGEATSTPSGELEPRSLVEFGVTTGTPGLAPLPSGAVEISTVATTAGAASAALSTITPTYKFAQVAGGVIFVRNANERDALVNPIPGDVCYVIDEKLHYARKGTSWEVLGAGSWTSYTPALTNFTLGTGGAAAVDCQWRREGDLIRVRWRFTFGLNGITVGTLPTFSLPVPLVPLVGSQFGVPLVNGVASIYDVSATVGYAISLGEVAGNPNQVRMIYLGAKGIYQPVANADPFGWQPGDTMAGEFTYRPAA